MAEKAELSECADKAGAEVLGLKVEVDKVRGHRVQKTECLPAFCSCSLVCMYFRITPLPRTMDQITIDTKPKMSSLLVIESVMLVFSIPLMN